MLEASRSVESCAVWPGARCCAASAGMLFFGLASGFRPKRMGHPPPVLAGSFGAPPARMGQPSASATVVVPSATAAARAAAAASFVAI